jgi:hypothetical protein
VFAVPKSIAISAEKNFNNQLYMCLSLVLFVRIIKQAEKKSSPQKINFAFLFAFLSILVLLGV